MMLFIFANKSLTSRFSHRHPGRPELDGLVEVDEGGDGDAGVNAGVFQGNVAHAEGVDPDAGGAVLHAVLRHARVGRDRSEVDVLKGKKGQIS